MVSFTIMVDTGCDLPSEFMKEHGIEALPITFTLDGAEHETGNWQNISSTDFYNALRTGSIAKTSQINPYAYTEVFTEYAKNGKALVLIVLSSGLSGTCQSAFTALQEVKESYPDSNIYLVDSISASVGIGMLATIAVAKRAEGLSAKETAALLEEKKHKCIGLFTVDDLMYLYRGGRLGKLSAIAGSVLSIKPILNLAPDGTLALKDRVRGRKASMKLLVEQFKRSTTPNANLDTVFITHTDCENDANLLAEMVKEAADIRQVIVMTMGPIIGAHVGPGALILLFEAHMTREEYEDKFYRKR